MRRGVRVRLYPSLEQESLLARTAAAARRVYNLGLGVRKDYWQEDGISVSTYDLMRMLPLWKGRVPVVE